jgi:NADH-quinone oxidoreductase subunit J
MIEPLAIVAVAATDNSLVVLLRKCIADPRAILATLTAAVGLWLLLPGKGAKLRVVGALLAAVGFGLFATQLLVMGDWFAQGLLGAIGGATVVAAVATISCRSPVYSAIWFGMTLAGTAGLFLLAGAGFLAIATVVVYAGAILVTFLFVLMLSQPEGHTTYDRRSWEALVSAITGALLVGVLTATIGASVADVGKSPFASLNGSVGKAGRATTRSFSAGSPQAGPLSNESDGRKTETYNVAQLGAELFTRYLVAVEAAGTLLFAALVGAAVIVAQGRAAMKGRSPLAGSGGTIHVR